MKVCEAMTPDVQLCTPEDTLKDARRGSARPIRGPCPTPRIAISRSETMPTRWSFSRYRQQPYIERRHRLCS
jgi:hypothetical protein